MVRWPVIHSHNLTDVIKLCEI
uniref:Uncharacterized protein n=1 Tax=Anguilla anguilla TaxID=7936 RepID=A0A0E9QV01_ANGAN